MKTLAAVGRLSLPPFLLALPVLIVLPVFGLSGCWFGSVGQSHAQRAAELRSQHQYDEAIAEYQKHMAERQKDKFRPANEIPAFYELLIGDTLLDAGRPEEAEAAYNRAMEAKVQSELVSFKLRHLSQYYESQNKLQTAIDLLKKYREHDPVMFDFDIDRLHKKLVSEEDSKAPLE